MKSLKEQLREVLESYQQSYRPAKREFVVEAEGNSYKVQVAAFYNLSKSYSFVLTEDEVELMLKRHSWMMSHLRDFRIQGVSVSVKLHTYCELATKPHLYLFSGYTYLRQVASRLLEV